MIKTSTAVTLGALMVCSPAFAQSTTTPPGTAPAERMAPAEKIAPTEKMVPEARAPSATTGTAMMATDDRLASKLIGTAIKSPSNETVGDISDLVLDSGGVVKAVIVGVGGFLGLGEHRVMLRYDQMQFNRDANGRLFVLSQLTLDQLKALPAWQDAEIVRTK